MFPGPTTLKSSFFTSLRRLGDPSGAAAVEFALVAPVYLVLVVGGLIFALAFSNYLSVTNAAYAGASQLIISRGQTTPYTTTVSAVDTAAGNLTTANLTITITVNGTTCSSDTTCENALTNAASQQASVTVSYPCSLDVLQYNFSANGCTLSSSVAGLVQ